MIMLEKTKDKLMLIMGVSLISAGASLLLQTEHNLHAIMMMGFGALLILTMGEHHG